MRIKKIFLLIKKFFIRFKLDYLFLFFISFALFFYLQNTKTFADPDSFYHARMALLIKDQGIIKEFPWLQFTTLKDSFTDHHFLYHLFLVSFISFLNPFMGVKVAAVFFAILLIIIIYWFLKSFKIKGAFFYSLLLLVINPFIFRISLAKVPVLSILFLILALYFLFNYKYWLLFILSFFYVWLYGGWPLMFVLTIIFVAVNSFDGLWRKLNKPSLDEVKGPLFTEAKGKEVNLVWPEQKRETRFKIKKIVSLFFNKLFSGNNLKLLLASFNGLLTGLIINPYFPQNLYFYWQQTIKIGLVNYQKIIGVGAEWYPYKFLDLVSGASLVFVLLLIALILFIIGWKKQTVNSWTLFLVSLFFFLFTLKSRRNVEYFIPFTIIFSALTINNFLDGIDIKNELYNFKNLFLKRKLLFISLAIYFIVITLFISVRDIQAARKDFENGFAFGLREKASLWLKNNTPQGSIVFHNHWDEFPIYFYYNSHNYYLVGLDPTFMYEYNKDLYWEWYYIVVGKDKENLYRKVKNDFRASFVLWVKERTSAEDNFSKDNRFKLLYEDREARVYQVL